MSQDKPEFDSAAAHRHWSVQTFNAAWDLIDKTERTPEEEDEMLRLAFASSWHWTQRADCAPKHRCVSYWQLSRVLALAGAAQLAARYAATSLEIATKNELGAFLAGYAYEALARAAAVAGDRAECERCLSLAHSAAQRVESEQERSLLMSDLEGLR